jgi:tetratricopeptide (TPR) repeat protein
MNRQLASVLPGKVETLAAAPRRQHGLGAAGAWLYAASAWLCLLVSACSHGPQVKTMPPTGAVAAMEMEPLQLEVSRSGTIGEVYDAPTLFEQAGEHMDADRYAEAAADYERLIKNFPDSPYVAPALYNAALCYEGLGRYADAAERYRQVLDEHGSSKEAKDATFRLGACYAETGRWVASSEVYAQAVKRDDLTLADRLEATARLGLAHFELHDLQVAERHFADAVARWKEQRESERLESNFFLAMSQFYLAHIAHQRFRELPMRLPQKQLEQDTEAKARAFMDAQAKYIDAIKLKNPSWATASGYHIGTLYRELYDALAKAPLPPEVSAGDQRVIYDLLLRDKLRVLLEKSKDILEKNLAMADRVGVKNGWVERSTEQLQEVERLLASLDGGGPLDKPEAPAEAPKLPARPKRDYRPRATM